VEAQREQVTLFPERVPGGEIEVENETKQEKEEEKEEKGD
jgi:hypothetical protein